MSRWRVLQNTIYSAMLSKRCFKFGSRWSRLLSAPVAAPRCATLLFKFLYCSLTSAVRCNVCVRMGVSVKILFCFVFYLADLEDLDCTDECRLEWQAQIGAVASRRQKLVYY